MSVAFRREGDDEHLEPKFELPIPPGPNLVTARGLAQIQSKVSELETMLAGLAEDAEIAVTRRDLRYWHTRKATAQRVDATDLQTVGFGTKVSICHNGQDRTITIVGNDEADPGLGLLAFSAPLCRAIMGAEVGDVLEYAGKPDAIEILAIEVAKT